MDNNFKNPKEKKRKSGGFPTPPNSQIFDNDEDLKIKYFADPVHSQIGFSELCMEIIDTPEYNRLRELKQLGLTHLVFPSATHTRFEHSLGVGFLSGTLVNTIKEKQPSLGITNKDVELVKIAGLCHDLGHGPFSHAFESWVHKKRPNFKHEDMSNKIFEKIINDNAIDLDRHDINFVKDLILGNKVKNKPFLSEVVSNSRNSLDVDKLDYLLRDAYHIGFSQKNLYTYQRLFNNCKVLDNQLCYHSKVCYDIYQVYSQRYDMFKRVYCHRVSLAIECMVSDVFDLSDHILKISERTDDVNRYVSLSDGILNTIQYYDGHGLEQAKELIRRIHKRQLYTYVEQLVLSTEDYDKIRHKLTLEELIKHKPKASNLTVDDFVMKTQTMNFAMGEKSPLNNISYYNKHSSNTSFPIDPKEISYMLPSNYSEKYVTLFCKKNDGKLLEDIQKTLRNFTHNNSIASPGNKDNMTPDKSIKRKRGTSEDLSEISQPDFEKAEKEEKEEQKKNLKNKK